MNIEQREDQQLTSQGYSIAKQDVHTGFNKTLLLSLHVLIALLFFPGLETPDTSHFLLLPTQTS